MLLRALVSSFSFVPSIDMFGNENTPREMLVYIDDSIVDAPKAERIGNKYS
jgi:hypothetical protein